MKQKTVLLVFGTRPEAIKMAPLVRTLAARKDDFRTVVCVSGQHRSMLDQVLDVFGITPDFDLDIMKPGQDLYDVTARVLTGMRDVLGKVNPDIVLVHGDTTTSTAAALAAFYRQVPVGHVEAGLRTHNVMSPWPEEMNRQITGRIASIHFAPTALGRENLLNEGVDGSAVMVTGNTVIDALHLVVDRIGGDRVLAESLDAQLRAAGYDCGRIAGGRRLVLVTGHRRENCGAGFISICNALKTLAEHFPDVDFVYPMHLNPNVRRPIAEVFGENHGRLNEGGDGSAVMVTGNTV
ncbi:MAG: UDP-N-acetylglucosamine 2-epimerase (non-hydrolyzing), partial [Muribaculaceae bacterium]|nr:UDP-N-acetylglucosamine 2-epimerase (non-hydrolyzing) [Muribaculaceae bacterium]